MGAMRAQKSDKLLILDLDETLIHATTEPLPGRAVDFRIGDYHVYDRPHCQAFIDFCFERMAYVAVWTSSSSDYAQAIIHHLFGRRQHDLLFMWSRGRCTRHRDLETFEEINAKNLKKIKCYGIPLERTIMLDDTPAKLRRHYGNLVRIDPFEGAADDQELVYAEAYLNELVEESNVRSVEKRGWRNQFVTLGQGFNS